MLPLSVVTRITSFNVENTSQLAHLRRVSRQFHKSLMAHLAGKGSSRHHIRCPVSNIDVVIPFLDALCDEEGCTFHEGDLIDVADVSQAIFDGATAERLRVLSRPDLFGCDDTESSPSVPIDRVLAVCDALERVESLDDLRPILSEIGEHSLAAPISGISTDESMSDYEVFRFSAFVTLSVSLELAAKCLRCHNGREWLELTTSSPHQGHKGSLHTIKAAHCDCSYIAPIVEKKDESWKVVVLLELDVPEDDIFELSEDRGLESLLVKTPWDKAQRNETLVEGVTIVDDLFAGRRTLLDRIDALEAFQEKSNMVDHHPNSNGVVRNLVHPALYCYVENVSPLHQPIMKDPAAPGNSKQPGEDDAKSMAEDFWGRPYEHSMYQWLPTYFSIAEDGSCSIEDYINNLVPRDSSVHAALYRELEKLFEHCLPFIESTYSYVQAIRPHLREYEEDVEYNRSPPEPPGVPYCSLRGKRLQVITKIVDYSLLTDQTHNGVWHVEGMSHEEILLTALYIADRDDDFVGADIQFKRAFLRREAEYLFSNIPQSRFPAVNDVVNEGLVPLGTVATPKGRLIVFPNSHVHKVSEMSFLPTSDGRKSTKRRIVVFFLVNPLRRIVSTREVAPQQRACGGGMSHEEALEYRRQLMHERRHTKQDWNVREIELCEH